MNLEEAMAQRLINAATIAGDRVTPMRHRQDAIYPLVSYLRVSAPRAHYTHDTVPGDPTLASIRLQYSLWTKSYTDMLTLQNQVKNAFSGYRNEAENIQGCMLAYELDDWEEATGLFKKIIDVQVAYRGN